MTIFQKKIWAAFFIMSIVLLFCCRPVAAVTAPEHFSFKMNPTYIKFKGGLTFFGQDVTPGDEIGVFAPGVTAHNGCVGGAVIEHDGFYMVYAYGDDTESEEKDGASHGDPLSFKLWRAGQIYDLESVNGQTAVWDVSKVNDDVQVNLTSIQGPVTPGFTFSPDSGCAPLTVQFTDTSQGEPDSWNWDFGDGETSSDQNPTHVFNSGGSFEVMLIAANSSGANGISHTVQVSSLPIAQFIGSTFTGAVPLTVEFMDQSQGIPTSWEWNFGDGNTSQDQNPSHIYTETGTYTVSLKVANDCGEHTVEKEQYITVVDSGSTGITAAFTANTTEGCSPSPVEFIDSSTGDPVSWQWDFGDGQTSTEQDPVHEYESPGIYTVTLTVINALGEMDSYERLNLVGIQSKPEASFTVESTIACPNTPVQFVDETAGTPTHWKWSFGDGETSTEQEPVHVYKTPGSYTVRLTVFSLCGMSMKQEANYIVVKGAPQVDFQAEQIQKCSDLTIQFTDQMDDLGDSWQWEFGDGATSSERNPVHSYTQAGIYQVILTASNGCASSNVTKDVMVLGPPVAEFSVPVSFAVPHQEIQFNDSSPGIPTMWLWDFGDGQTSESQNPIHEYSSPGKYTVKLGVKNGCGSHVISRTVLIGTESEAYFVIDSDTVCMNTPVAFTNISAPDFNSWEWDFGDGATSLEKDPVHTFEAAGTYQVKLSASKEYHSHNYEETVIVLDTPYFIADKVKGCAPLTVQFHDLSGNASDWLWNFGDGQSSMKQNPIHTYSSPGTYTVDLTYSNSCGSALEAGNSLSIEVKNILQADFEVDKMSGPAPLRVEFQDRSIGSAASTWDFGDGEGSIEQNPFHIYQKPGFHGVSLTVSNEECESVKVLKGIDVYDPGLIKGQVLDSKTNQPVSGVKIQVLGQENKYLTNMNGEYSIPNLRSGYYALSLTFAGYESALVQEILVRPGEETNKDMYLNAAEGIISGVVTGNDSSPIAGATVVALNMGDEEHYSRQAITDIDGTYTVYLGQSGTYKLVASAPGYVPKTDNNQGTGYIIDPDSGSTTISDCQISLTESFPGASEIKICSFETQSGSSQGERQTKILVSVDPNFAGEISVDFDPDVMGEISEGMLSMPQLVDGNRPYYEVVYSEYTGKDIERVGISVKVTLGGGSITIPHIFPVNSSDTSGKGLCLKGVSKNITPAEGGTSYELGWIDLDGDEKTDQYDESFVEIPACSLIDAQGAVDFEISSLVVCLNRISNPEIPEAAVIYDIELLDETGKTLEGFQVDADNPILVHLHCNPLFLGINPGNLAVRYQDENGNWKKDGIKNVHLSDHMATFTVTHLTPFALLRVNSEPSHAVVQVVSETQLDLTWDDNSESELGFEVWRCVNNDPAKNVNYDRVIITDPNITGYSDLNCQLDDTYTYKIRALTQLGATAYSTPGGKALTECDLVPYAPQNLKVKSISNGEVEIEWTDASGCESGFDIYRKASRPEEFKKIGSVASDVTSYKDSPVSAGVKYFYMVKATSSVGESEASNELEVVTLSPGSGGGGSCFLSVLDSCDFTIGRWIVKKIQMITQ